MRDKFGNSLEGDAFRSLGRVQHGSELASREGGILPDAERATLSAALGGSSAASNEVIPVLVARDVASWNTRRVIVANAQGRDRHLSEKRNGPLEELPCLLFGPIIGACLDRCGESIGVRNLFHGNFFNREPNFSGLVVVQSCVEGVLDQLSRLIPAKISLEGLNAGVMESTILTADDL